MRDSVVGLFEGGPGVGVTSSSLVPCTAYDEHRRTGRRNQDAMPDRVQRMHRSESTDAAVRRRDQRHQLGQATPGTSPSPEERKAMTFLSAGLPEIAAPRC